MVVKRLNTETIIINIWSDILEPEIPRLTMFSKIVQSLKYQIYRFKGINNQLYINLPRF